MKKIVIITLLLIIFASLFASGLKETIKERVDSIHVADEWKVFLISMLPIFELRGAIPMGMHSYRLPLWKVVPIAITGNMVPIFFILLFFDWVTKICFRFPFTRKILEAIFARTRSKSAVIEKYEEVGLMFFVAIPLPITGAWTGSLAAYLFGLPFWKSILFIFLGVCIAAVVVSSLSYLKWFGLAIAVVALTVIFAHNYLKKRNRKCEV